MSEAAAHENDFLVMIVASLPLANQPTLMGLAFDEDMKRCQQKSKPKYFTW